MAYHQANLTTRPTLEHPWLVLTEASTWALRCNRGFTETVRSTRLLHLRCLERIVSHRHFDVFFCIGIVLHAVASAVTSDLSVKSSIQMYENQSHETSSLSRTVEIFFTVFFGIEVGLRIAGLEGEFFAGSDWKWNLSDFCVVLVSTSYLVLPGIFSNSSVSLIFVARLGRLLRLLRLVKYMPLLSKLRVLTLAVTQCYSMLVWAVLVLLVIKFLFAVVFLHAVAEYIRDAPEFDPNVEEMKYYFGSLSMTMLTLFMSVTGGVDWWQVAQLLFHISATLSSSCCLWRSPCLR